MTYPVLDIANKLLLKATEYDGGELMSNMKLQKMLYYQQGYHLAAFGTPLFSEEVEAWMYGPVVPCVYEHFKKFGAGGIIPETQTPTLLVEEEEALFYDVFNAYINFSALGLMEKTHNESPWLSTPRGVGNVISKDKMRRYFEKQLA
ncbi:Panacea domain-containing protein [Alistipes sp. CHKCI003]|uniref:Panacea domain-containing protein n=1 Tax=Alistipes sp. CHKCI003 TaxID=1780376 RepID=UPI0007A92B48|nr:type II toxin-antitoxin system antitoxin SocA domain-containing protein [Alistipes sp. CHKCI003]CVI68039.1 hypothetical protein BN3659_01044 [Alistipes sp. CHKCI003]